MAAQGLSGFYGSVFKRSTAAYALIRTVDGRILMMRAGSGGWVLPGGVVKGGEDPRSAAQRGAGEALGAGFDVGRVLVLDYVQGGDRQGGAQGDSIVFVFDGGTLATSVTGFSGAGGEREARFVALGEGTEVFGAATAGLLAAAVEAQELGTVTELVDGRPARGEHVLAPPPRRMMPPVDGFSGILGR
ncbi:NUDIX hydrolase [Arthrobacter sp. ATA002]|uniref:NUDIX domain-containing protein n=1 Tax=Arthrobacter sp. ATA002 TaxID=2991715 RepID=UPI0022A6AB1C|nr:NUDIX hydrolase [Arthrobacter sp. ATA002]WAP52943.1 NUDIX hydrolase [Arthrobacter sp. ATA002]